MINFQRKRGWSDIIQSKPVLIIFGILILIFSWSIFGFWIKMDETGKNKKLIEDKVALLEQQKTKLSADINSLETDQGKEKIFRENFGLAKDGEDMIVIVDDKNASLPPVSSNSTGFFGFLRNLFK